MKVTPLLACLALEGPHGKSQLNLSADGVGDGFSPGSATIQMRSSYPTSGALQELDAKEFDDLVDKMIERSRIVSERHLSYVGLSAGSRGAVR